MGESTMDTFFQQYAALWAGTPWPVPDTVVVPMSNPLGRLGLQWTGLLSSPRTRITTPTMTPDSLIVELPQKGFFRRSGIQTIIVLFGAQAVESLCGYLFGLHAPWAPPVIAGIRAAWMAYKDPSTVTPDVLVRPLTLVTPKEGV